MSEIAVLFWHRLQRGPSELVIALAVPCVLLLSIAPAHALPEWLDTFVTRYPSATRLDTCGLCHKNFNQNSARNAYGNAFRAADGPDDANSAMQAIESDDSDGDGTSNVDEILLMTGFMPGYDCTTYTDTVGAPVNLADYVDPTNVGCLAVPTTTTSTSTTTLPPAACAQPLTDGPQPTATDCLFILQAAVSLVTCDPPCVCAPKGTLPASASDALLCLQKATGQDVSLACPC